MAASDTVVFRYTATKLVLLGLLGIGMTALSASVGLRIIPSDAVGVAAGLFGTAFFALCTLIAFVRLSQLGRDVVRLTPSGITDKRLADAEIPWTAIAGMTSRDVLGNDFLLLQINPAVERTLSLKRRVRLSRAANAGLGFDGLAISPQGLDVGFDALEGACRERWERLRREP